jgi:shikimate dehydrogenase
MRFALDPHVDNYCVMGTPIAHSLSPRIHAAFAVQTGTNLCYQAVRVEPGSFADTVREFRAAGGMGANVTLPYKRDAWELAEVRSPRADLAGSVNTLRFEEHGCIFGDNTDGVGFLRDYLQNHHGEIRERRVLILGAGGAVRGVLGPILEQQPARVVIANRGVEKAETLQDLFLAHGPLTACGYADLTGHPFDLIINGTSASLAGDLPPLPDGILAPGGDCYDMMYQLKEPTLFVHWGMQHGAALSLDGLGMLVEQAAESFFLWRGVRPVTAPVITLLRNG